MMTAFTNVFGSNTLPPAEYGYRAVVLTEDAIFVWPYNSSNVVTTIAKIMDISCDLGNSLILPSALEVSTGEDFLIRNVGSEILTVKDSTGGTVGTVLAGAASYYYLTNNSTAAGIFGTIAYGVGTSAVDAASLIGYGIKAIGSSLNQAHPVIPVSSDDTIDVDDRAALIVFTGASGTFTLPDAMATGDDFFTLIKNGGTGTLTLNAGGSDLIDGVAGLTIQPSESLIVFCSGTAWFTVGYGRSIAYQFSQLVKDVSAGGTITLTAAEAANKMITFIGNPAANLNVVVPSIVAVYYTYNHISTAFSVTVKTAVGAGAIIPQTNRAILLCDGTDILSAQSFIASTTLNILNGSVSAPSLSFTTQTNTGIYKFGAQGFGVAVNGATALQLEPTRAFIAQPLDYIRLKLNAAAPATSEGTLYYNSTSDQLIYYNNVGAVTMAPLVSPTFTGDPKAPTPAPGDSDTSIATTAYVQLELADYALISSPTFTGDPKAPTPPGGDNDTSIATTQFVQTELVDYALLASPTFTGTPAAPTAPFGTSTTQLATTEFVSALAFSSVLPAQLGNSGKFLTTDGVAASWQLNLPVQTNNAGKLLTTNGTTTSWVSPSAGPSLYLATNYGAL